MLKLESFVLSEPAHCTYSPSPLPRFPFCSVESWAWGSSFALGSLVASWEEGQRERALVQVLRVMETQMLAGPLGRA